MTLLSELLREYLARLRSRNYSPRTIENTEARLRVFIQWLSVNCGVAASDKLQARYIRQWQRNLLSRRTPKGFPLKPGTLNLRITLVTTFLRYLAKDGHVAKTLPDALERVRHPEVLPSSVLNHSQVRKLFSKISLSSPLGYRDRTMLELLYSSGLRAKEILALDVGDINFEQGSALVHGKGGKDRIVPVGRTALRYLQSYIKGVRLFMVHDPNESALFLTLRGNRCAYHMLRQILDRYIGRCNFDVRVTPHTFRRSCTTELIRGGANMYHVKELLGHQSLEMLKRYARLTITDLKKTHEKCHPRERDERLR